MSEPYTTYTGKYPNKIMSYRFTDGAIYITLKSGKVERIPCGMLLPNATPPRRGMDFSDWKHFSVYSDSELSARDINSTMVALCLGLDNVDRFEALPAGFRLNWEKVEADPRYTGVMTYGDMTKLYCAVLTEAIDMRAKKD